MEVTNHGTKRNPGKPESASRPRIGLTLYKSMLIDLDAKAKIFGVLRSPAVSFAICAWLDGQIQAQSEFATYAGDRTKVYVTLHPQILSRLDEMAASLGIQRSAAAAVALTAWLKP